MFIRSLTLSIITFVSFFGLSAFFPACGDAAIDMSTLLDEMTDLDRLASADDPPYVARQFSSYDRKSTDPTIQTTDNWFANRDRGQHLRTEEVNGRTEYVLMDTDGPGSIVRFWSANPDEGGIVKIYLDHQPTPVLEASLQDFLGGKVTPFVPPICGERSRGWNSFFPIPFAKHCKVSITEGDIYYVIGYRVYGPDVTVETFTLDKAKALSDKIDEVAGVLAAPYRAVDASRGDLNAYDVTLVPGSMESMTLTGPAAIYRITCKAAAEDMERALRGCVLSIDFDGRAPAVMAPLGDFFATAPGANPYQSLTSGVLEDGLLYSHWVMPFQETATVKVHNTTDMVVSLSGEVGVVDRPWTDTSMYFHANWRTEKDIPTRPMQDWTYVDVKGAGRFCGVMLHMANPVPDWWGEGDEKIYVDGETFPSFFGTGSEDYFGYAWCNPALFTHAYHNQPRCDGPGNMGHSCVSRFQIMDDIPFSSSLKFDMEVWHSQETKVTQATMAYWYGLPGAAAIAHVIAPESLAIPDIPEPPGVEGALEGEKMRVVSASAGQVSPQSGPWRWSRAFQLWWRHAKPGDTLVLGFQVDQAGSYDVRAAFTQAPDFGIHQLSVNGEKAGKPLDLYHEKVIVAKERSLGRFHLKQGENLLEVRITGKRPEALPGCMFGLDYLRLAP